MCPHPNWGHPDHDACGTGFVARLGGAPNHDIVEHALTALERLTHRGGVDADGASGDGAGLLTSLPEAFFRARAQGWGTASGAGMEARSGKHQFAGTDGVGDHAGDLAILRRAISPNEGRGAI